MADGEVPVAMALPDGPDVTVLDRVSAASGGHAALVVAGDDAVTDFREVFVVHLDRVGGDVAVADAFKAGGDGERGGPGDLLHRWFPFDSECAVDAEPVTGRLSAT